MVSVYRSEELKDKVEELDLQMAIIAVPAEYAQVAADQLVAASKAILNLHLKLTVPEGVHLASADLSLELQRLAYYLGTKVEEGTYGGGRLLIIGGGLQVAVQSARQLEIGSVGGKDAIGGTCLNRGHSHEGLLESSCTAA